jgi:hypothetical protein
LRRAGVTAQVCRTQQPKQNRILFHAFSALQIGNERRTKEITPDQCPRHDLFNGRIMVGNSGSSTCNTFPGTKGTLFFRLKQYHRLEPASLRFGPLS